MDLQRNLLLACLTPEDLALLRPHIRSVDLKQQTILFEIRGTVKDVYFPTDCIVSLVIPLLDGHTVESAMIGRDGVVGAASALNGQIPFTTAIVQHAHTFSCDSRAFKDAANESRGLTSLMWRHENVLYAQSQQSTACMSAHDVEARLCRWLLRSRDLRGSDELFLTQEFLGEMLGVRRTSVTVAAQTLQHAGLISYRRGKVTILNVEGLKEASCECFETVRRNYDTLLGRRPNADLS